eukprot:6558426-Prymnesium_polylepis.1
MLPRRVHDPFARGAIEHLGRPRLWRCSSPGRSAFRAHHMLSHALRAAPARSRNCMSEVLRGAF